jgi:hypothetical protein
MTSYKSVLSPLSNGEIRLTAESVNILLQHFEKSSSFQRLEEILQK